MPIYYARYHSVRNFLLDHQTNIIKLEQQYMGFLETAILGVASKIYDDFCRAGEMIPFWQNYSPRQRGRAPTGLAAPWSEVGQTTISANLLGAVVQADPTITFPGIPFGGDVRFAVKHALLHVDVKSTGPNDDVDEVVVPPQQVSGDGLFWANGVTNSSYQVRGPRGGSFPFQPKLPPFYIADSRIRVCLTYFLKGIYEVRSLGDQPLSYLELVCVPNGLLMFDGPRFAAIPDLLRPGKDDKTVSDENKRARIKLDPLAALDPWRCMKIILDKNGKWTARPRYQVPAANPTLKLLP